MLTALSAQAMPGVRVYLSAQVMPGGFEPVGTGNARCFGLAQALSGVYAYRSVNTGNTW